MSLSSAYLETSRHDIFYFRIRVPTALRSLFPSADIRRSLQTKCRREAVLRSASLLEQVQYLFDVAAEGKAFDLVSLSWIRPKELDETVGQPVVATPAKPKTPKLSKLLNEYLKQQELEGVSAKTIRDKRSVTNLLIEIVGDKPVGNIWREEAKLFKETALRLPPRYEGGAGRKLNDLIKNAKTTISITTYNNYIKNLVTVFGYAEKLGVIDKNTFSGLKIKQRVKPSEQRARFTDEDLKLIFSTPIHTLKKYKHPYQYWLPLMGLFTGARLNELCQLYLEDFKVVDGVKCIHIQAKKPDQKLKTVASERLIPIHARLLEAGLWEFVQSLKDLGQQRLFPELRRHKSNGYAHYATKWFMRLRERLGLKGGDEKKDFHSFRHTVADELKQKGMAESLIAGLLGHQAGGVTFSRYGKDYKPEVLIPVMELVCFSAVDDGICLASSWS